MTDPQRMLRLVFVLLALAGWTAFELATDRIGVFVAAQMVSYVAFEQITVANTSIGFTALKVEPDATAGGRQADTASCRLRTAEVSYVIDGSTPTTTVGMLLEPGDTITVSGHDSIMRFRAIRTGATSGQLDCSYTAK